MKPLGILLIAFSLVSCDEPPIKPTLEVCVLDVENDECICGKKEPNKPVSNLRREALPYCEKSTAFRPSEWEKYKKYVDGLEAWIDRNRKKKK